MHLHKAQGAAESPGEGWEDGSVTGGLSTREQLSLSAPEIHSYLDEMEQTPRNRHHGVCLHCTPTEVISGETLGSCHAPGQEILHFGVQFYISASNSTFQPPILHFRLQFYISASNSTFLPPILHFSVPHLVGCILVMAWSETSTAKHQTLKLNLVI